MRPRISPLPITACGIARHKEPKLRTAILAGALFCAASNTLAEEIPFFVLPTVVVTPQRFEAAPDSAPASVTVITREQIANSPAGTIPDLIARQAGINLQDLYGNNASHSTLDLRGFGATAKQNTLVLLDGKRISDIDLTTVQWAGIPLEAIERIEIVRGAGTVLYGEGATNGVINLISRQAPHNQTSGTLTARIGSYDTHEASAYLAYNSGTFGLNIAANDYRSDGYRRNNLNEQSNLFSTLRWATPVGEFALRLAADRQDIRLPGSRRIQPSIGLNEYESDRRGAQTPLDYASRDGNNIALAWTRALSGHEVTSEISLRNKTQKSYFDQSGFPDYREIELSVLGITPRAKLVFSPNNELILGADFYHWDFNLKKANAVANIGQPINRVSATEDTLGLYAQDTLKLGRNTTLTLGVRGESFEIDGTDIYDAGAPGASFGSGAPAGRQHEFQYSYELGLRQRFNSTLSGFAKLGRSFRFANVDEAYESDVNFNNGFQFLRPQTALDRQLGLEYAAGPNSAKIALFHTDIKDEIHLDPYTTGIGNTNLPPSRRYGLELDGRWQPLPNWSLGANYSYTEAAFRSGVLPGSGSTRSNVGIAGKAVPLVPRHKINLDAQWSPVKGSTITLAATHVSKQFLDNDEPNDLGVTIPAYTVVDLKFAQKFGAWQAALAINNLFDEQYYNYAVRSQFTIDRYAVYPLPGRAATASLSYRF